MNPNPRHGTPAGDATIALRKLARQTGGDVQELMTLYALEGLLARIAISEYRDDFVLKGGVLLAAFAARRPTKDIDLQATRLTDDPDEVAERVRAIARLELADGLLFDPASVTATTIRDEDEYAGVRVKAHSNARHCPADRRNGRELRRPYLAGTPAHRAASCHRSRPPAIGTTRIPADDGAR